MTDVTNELLLDGLRQIQADLAGMKAMLRIQADDIRGIKAHLGAMLMHQSGSNEVVARLTLRVERIERRLDLTD
jgi:hypothetical protein